MNKLKLQNKNILMNINILNNLNNKLWIIDDRINELEDISIEFTKSEKQRKNRLKRKNKQPQRLLRQ